MTPAVYGLRLGRGREGAQPGGMRVRGRPAPRGAGGGRRDLAPLRARAEADEGRYATSGGWATELNDRASQAARPRSTPTRSRRRSTEIHEPRSARWHDCQGPAGTSRPGVPGRRVPSPRPVPPVCSDATAGKGPPGVDRSASLCCEADRSRRRVVSASPGPDARARRSGRTDKAATSVAETFPPEGGDSSRRRPDDTPFTPLSEFWRVFSVSWARAGSWASPPHPDLSRGRRRGPGEQSASDLRLCPLR